MFYSYNGEYPTLLTPKLKALSEEELASEGWVLSPNKPLPVAGKFIDWDGSDWYYRDPTESELFEEWAKVRKVRDDILNSTDKYILIAYERGAEVPQVYKDYRQALRDLPENTENPFTVVFPSLNDEDDLSI